MCDSVIYLSFVFLEWQVRRKKKGRAKRMERSVISRPVKQNEGNNRAK